MHMLDSRHAPTVCVQPPKRPSPSACRAASSSLHQSQGCSGILVNTPTPPLQEHTAYTHRPALVANAYTTAARVWPRVWIQSIEGSVWGAWMPWVPKLWFCGMDTTLIGAPLAVREQRGSTLQRHTKAGPRWAMLAMQ